MKEPVESLSDQIRVAPPGTLPSLLSPRHPADIAEALRDLDPEERRRVLRSLKESVAATVLDEEDEATRIETIEVLDNRFLSEILNKMPPDEATDLLGDLPPEESSALLSLMEPEKSREVRELLKFPEDTAGGIMTPNLLAVREGMRVGEVMEFLRSHADPRDILYIYVTDGAGRFQGIVPLRRLVTASPSAMLDEVLDRSAVTVSVTADQEEIARIFQKYDLLAVPVLDERGRLVGRITVDDVMEVMQEEATEDAYKLAGSDDEELSAKSAWGVARFRLPWLIGCFVGSLLTGSIIHFFQVTLSQAISLAVFIPTITATGGNAGLQTTTITVRGLATGRLNPVRLFEILLKEIKTALCIASVCALIAWVVANLWLGQALIGAAVGISIFLAITIAACLGIIVPLSFKRLGLDPAVASGPLITTMNDVTGLFVYFGVSTLILRFFA